MTEVTLFRSRQDGGRLAGFEAKGHTMSAESGEDIVCAGISALTQTAVMGLVEYLKLECGFSIGDGSIYCMLSDDISKKDWREAEIILETMAMGLRSIAETYGDYIKLIEREV